MSATAALLRAEDVETRSVPRVRPFRSGGRTTLLCLLSLWVLQAVQVLFLHWRDPRFFWLDDSQAQFGPTAWWAGQHLSGGRPPLLDADLGSGGNFVADIQYGTLDPLHWVLDYAASRTTNLLHFSWFFGALCMVLLGTGSLLLLLRHRVHPALAVAGAVGIASSGFYLWYGSSWWPVLWSVCWLPWLWLGLRGRSWQGVLVTGLAVWALIDAGNPYALPFAALLVVAQAVERCWGRGRRALLDPSSLARGGALLGGFVIALPTLLSVVQNTPVMSRPGPEMLIGNQGFGVPNLLDVVVGGPTLMGQTNSFFGYIGLTPAMATLAFALPLAALVSWRRALRRPGVLTAGSVYLAGLVATQLPTTFSVFRYPFRYLVIVQVFLPLLVLIAVSVAPVLTRRRLVLAGGLTLLTGLLAAFRAPDFLAWHVLGVVVVGAGAAAAVVLLTGRAGRRVLALSAVVAVGAAAVVLPVGVQMMIRMQERADAQAGTVGLHRGPLRALYEGEAMGATVQDYRTTVFADDQVLTAIAYDFGLDNGRSLHLMRGNGNLLAGLYPGFGSIAVGQEAYNSRWCHSFDGLTCSDPAALLAPAPGTGTAWVDLLSADTVIVSTAAPRALVQHFDTTRALVRTTDQFREYVREDGLPGRVTHVDGVQVDPAHYSSGPAWSGTAMDTYRVTTGARAGSLVLRVAYWPGMRATLNGRDLPVSTVDGAVVRLDVPAGVTSGQLQLSYRPVGDRILVPALAVGAILVLGSAVLGSMSLRGGRARSPRGAEHT